MRRRRLQGKDGANIVAVSPAAVSRWSSGKATPDLRTQTVIADLRYVVDRLGEFSTRIDHHAVDRPDDQAGGERQQDADRDAAAPIRADAISKSTVPADRNSCSFKAEVSSRRPSYLLGHFRI